MNIQDYTLNLADLFANKRQKVTSLFVKIWLSAHGSTKHWFTGVKYKCTPHFSDLFLCKTTNGICQNIWQKLYVYVLSDPNHSLTSKEKHNSSQEETELWSFAGSKLWNTITFQDRRDSSKALSVVMKAHFYKNQIVWLFHSSMRLALKPAFPKIW